MRRLVIKGREIVSSRPFQVSAAFGTALVLSGVAGATDSAATIADYGVDVGATITAAIAVLGPIVSIAIGGYFAWKLLRMALRWSGKALGGK